MKIVAIGIICLGMISCVRVYINKLKLQLSFIQDWRKIFYVWKEWIDKFSFSVDELIDNTSTDVQTIDLYTTSFIKGKTISQIIEWADKLQYLQNKEKQLVCTVLSGMGQSLKESELENLSFAIDALGKLSEEKESILKERTTLLYKLTPLLCGALAILLW